jgi:hypothetical protein
MNSTIWEQLGNNLQVERALKMEATNSTVTKTHGHLCNICFTFDDIDIYLQVQVMPNAPYDILLGRSMPSPNASPRTSQTATSILPS